MEGQGLVDGGGRPRLAGRAEVSKWRWKARLTSGGGGPKLVGGGPRVSGWRWKAKVSEWRARLASGHTYSPSFSACGPCDPLDLFSWVLGPRH